MDLTWDVGTVTAQLSAAARKQMPFAQMLALNKTAEKATDELKSNLKKEFVIRSPWVAKGIRYKRARKNDLEVAIGSRDQFMQLQAEGGQKTGKGGKATAVPRAIRKTPTSKTPRSKWPGKLLAKPRHFVIKGKDGKQYLLKRTGKGKRAKTTVLYAFAESVKVEPRWELEATVNKVFKRHWAREQVKAWDHALRTRRK